KRYLADIPKPLESTGDYTLIKGVGIDWHTREPFDSEAIVTARGVVTMDDGNATVRDGGDTPAQQAAIHLLSALLTLDVATLATSFDLFGAADGARWSLGLRPRAQDVATFIRDATISGAAQVETVDLHDANGDRTSIEFNDVAYDPSAPSAAEQARFER
ncbi:MAG TPA: outer membrane lipoprotein carrier protein LolA, partial [Pseudomonadales bacterium]|nr:outer membrane lipoprotein carrier protein LolA [Pseudomonadales bacterium]